MKLRKLFIFGMVGALGTPAHWSTTSSTITIRSRAQRQHLDAGPNFFSVALGTGILNALLVYLGVDLMGMRYLLVQIGATLIVFLANFVLNSAWTFREEIAK